eukprot:scaffold2319_cov406-Prasinococcus_capsulatus_cf.AAC.11
MDGWAAFRVGLPAAAAAAASAAAAGPPTSYPSASPASRAGPAGVLPRGEARGGRRPAAREGVTRTARANAALRPSTVWPGPLRTWLTRTLHLAEGAAAPAQTDEHVGYGLLQWTAAQPTISLPPLLWPGTSAYESNSRRRYLWGVCLRPVRLIKLWVAASILRS